MNDLKLEFKINKNILFIFVAIVGIIFRFLVGQREPNYDFFSWEIVANLFNDNKIIYSNTSRYNYGPIWFHVLGFSKTLNIDFRIYLISFLTFLDFIIFLLVWKMGKVKESILFFLCPISIVISGYHHQFENFAIVTILFGLYFIVKRHGFNVNFNSISFGETVILSILIGLSLTIKHIFILFPLWLFFQTNQFYKRVFVLFFPIVIFFLSFYPYWNEAKEGIIANVFNYASFNNFPIYHVFFADLFYIINNWNDRAMRTIFLILIAVVGFALRKRNLFESFLLYTACFVCFSPAIANQYLVIPILFLSFFFYSSALFYYLIGAIILILLDCDGLHYLTNVPPYSQFSSKLFLYKIISTFLFVNILSAIYDKDYFAVGISNSIKWTKNLLNDIYDEFLKFFGLGQRAKF
ncbi:MAG: hypothetical protein K2Q22_02130 [Cytophagales bacterium]|nr:hypothetical protein [Cytophagales bacterium]